MAKIFNHSTLIIFEEINGKSCLYECRCAEVVLEGFSLKVQARALELGFAPAVPVNGYLWHPSKLYCPNCLSFEICPLNDAGDAWICEKCLTTWLWPGESIAEEIKQND